MKFLMMLIAVATTMVFSGMANAQTPVGFDTVYPVISTGAECSSIEEAQASAMAVWEPALVATLQTIPEGEIVEDISVDMCGPHLFDIRQVFIPATNSYVNMYTCTIQGGILTTVMEQAP